MPGTGLCDCLYDGCLYKDAESGMVLYDTAACDGCGRCLNACRMGAISLNRHGKIQKCDGCIERQRAGKTPACVRCARPGRCIWKNKSDIYIFSEIRI